jgi:hypothetical protein
MPSVKLAFPRSLTLWVTIFLVVFTSWKMIAITSASPLIAYPDNWDFARVESCMGLWQDYGNPSIDAHLSGPVNRLVLNRKIDMDMCAVSVDTLFPYIVTRFFKTGDLVDFRYIGGLRVCVVMLGLCGLLWVARTPGRRLVVAGLFALAFGEFGYIAYMNTLYNEFTVIFGVFVATAALWLAFTSKDAPSRGLRWLLYGSIICLGLAKPQFAPLAAVVGIIGALVMLQKAAPKLSCIAMGLAGFVAMILLAAGNPSGSGFGQRLKLVNITDTVFTEVLRHAPDPQAALRDLRLPEKCSVMIGKSFYSPGVDQHHPCPEVINVSRMRLIPLFFKQPQTLFGPLSDAIAQLRPFPGLRYHFFEDLSSADSIRFLATKFTSLGTYLNHLPELLFRLIIITSVIVCIPMVIWCVIGPLYCRQSAHGASLLFATGGFLVLYSIASSVFGDGSTELPKHTFLWCYGVGVEFAGAILFLAELTWFKVVAPTSPKDVLL